MQEAPIAIPQQRLDAITRRVADAELGYAPDDDSGWKYGVDHQWLLGLRDYWLGTYDWRLSERSVWTVERMLLDWPHRRITSSDARIGALRKRYVAFRKTHGYKPWKYYKGRERWTPLPPEFASRG